MTSSSFYDDLIRDYLLFRGFTSTLKAFEAELKVDKDKGFRVDRIVDQLNSLITSYDLTGLREAWNHLDQRVFSRLEHHFLSTVRRLENGLLKVYVVNAVQTNRQDKLFEFFEKMSAELQNQPEWKEWFVLPFVKSPEDNPTFTLYFTKQWQDTLFVSLHNFISVVFQMFKDTPTLLSYEAEQIKMTKLLHENETLKQKLADLLGKDKYETGSEVDCTTSASVKLMDDFYIIAQEAPPTENKTIRSIIRNISSGLPTSPILGRKQTTTGNLVQSSANTVRRENTDDTSTSDKFNIIRGKSRKSSLPTSSSDIRRNRSLFENESSIIPDNGSSHDKEVGLNSGSKLIDDNLRCDPTDSSQMILDSSIKSKIDDGTEVSSTPPFILLSQDRYGEHHASITHCKFNTSGSLIASSDLNGVINIWSPSPLPQTLTAFKSKSTVLALDWACKMDKLLLAGNQTGTIRLYDTKEKKTLCEVDLESESTIRDHRIMCLACNPMDTSFVCCTSYDTNFQTVPMGSDVTGRLMLWDMKSMKLEKLFSLEPFSSAINCCVFNHNGQLLLGGAADGRISLFDMRSCECIAMWHGHQGYAYTVQFSPDETSCYSLGEDGLFNKWSINKTGQKMSCTPLHQDATGSLANKGTWGPSRLQSECNRFMGKLFASDSEGKHFLTCASTGGIVYSLIDDVPKNVMSLGGHKSPVVTVDYSTAGDCGTCITASIDGDIRVSTILAQK